jgi:hypothetical protein
MLFGACSSESNSPSTGGRDTGAAPSGKDAAAATSGQGGNADAAKSGDAFVGNFAIALHAPSDSDQTGHTSIVGKIYDGLTPAQIIWEQASQSGGCTLSKPRVPFCSTPCGGSAVCVDDDTCQPYPTAHDVGTVKVSGVKTSDGATQITLLEVAKTYQPSGDVKLPFRAVDEGAAIELAASGGDYSAFKLDAKGIAPLALAAGTLQLQRDLALHLAWTAAGQSGISQIHVKLDISHHGGSKGMIECEADDNGSLDLPAEQINALLDFGASGYPTVIVTRHSDATAVIKPGPVQLSVTSQVEKAVTVPGLASCSSDKDCSDGKTCTSDLSCK